MRLKIELLPLGLHHTNPFIVAVQRNSRCEGQTKSLIIQQVAYFQKQDRPSGLDLIRCSDYVMGWTIQGSSPGWGEGFFCFPECPDRSWGPPSRLYNGYQVSFPGVKRPGRGVYHAPQSSTEVKERVELYAFPPFGPSGPDGCRILSLPFYTTVLCNRN